MTELLTLSPDPPVHPGMDFAQLRREGLALIEQLGSANWTNYNTADPGITILEQLCYVITDLSYRLDFDMADLLAAPPGATEKESRQFSSAREILTVNPLTQHDYRKLIIDLDGVKNVWLEPITEPQPTLYHDPETHNLSFDNDELSEPVRLNGLYRVLIEKSPELADEAALLEAVTTQLQRHRNLCEDFAEIKLLPLEEIRVNAELEIADGFEANALMAQIYAGMERFISPSIDFFSLQTLLEQGKAVEDIFNGPPLRHGFIDDEQLRRFERHVELHTSDLIHIILDIPGIKAVKSFTLASDRTPEVEPWVLPLDPDYTPRLQSFDSLITADAISFIRGEILAELDPVLVRAELQALQSESLSSNPSPTAEELDFAPPKGNYRELADYVSIQHEFPATYGIGAIGLPASASPLRQAQAKQLQAYLTFFDQLLANYFAQLDHVRDLFSFNNESFRTYFSQTLTGLPQFTEILRQNLDEYTETLTTLTEQPETGLERKNRLLDHLLARYSENFPDPSLLRYEVVSARNQSPAAKMVEDKLALLQAYPQIGAERGRAFDYRNAAGLENLGDNISGLKRRLCSLLGIPYIHGRLSSKSNTEGFHLLEHILLRPRPSDTAEPTGSFFELAGPEQDPDPYSFQISIVLPTWPDRFRDEKFRKLVDDLLIAETPAHITIYRHWLGKTRMERFEDAYDNWFQMTTIGASNAFVQASADRVIEALEMGRSLLPLPLPVTQGLILHLSGDTLPIGDQWSDISDQGYHAIKGVGCNMPILHHVTNYNGQNFKVMRFDPDDGMILPEELDLQKPFTAMIVDRYYGDAKNTSLRSETGSNWVLGKWAGRNICKLNGTVGDVNQYTIDKIFSINTATMTDSPSWYLDGEQMSIRGETGLPGRLGLAKKNAEGWRKGSHLDIATVLIWDRVLSDQERQAVEKWLAEKYGIALTSQVE